MLTTNSFLTASFWTFFRTKFNISARWNSTRVTNTFMPEIAKMKSESVIKTHEDLYRFSVKHPDQFWGVLGASRVSWMKSFERASDCDMKTGKINWFTGGRLNVAMNCVDRHADREPERIALIWEKDEPGQEEKITYRQLYNLTNQLANTLKKHGIKKGDRVAIYMPTSPIAVAALLGCARIGAIHSVIFAGFSAEALAARIQDADAKLVITTDEISRGGKKINLKATVDEAVNVCPSVTCVLVSRRTSTKIPAGPKYFCLEDEMAQMGSDCAPAEMDSNDPLFMLYTSGSTGKPKGLIHSQAGFLVYASVSLTHVFDYRVGDIFCCVADIGWITGHTYIVYGTLCNGGTTVLFESIPTYPDPGRYWEMVQRLKPTHFYGSPTAIRLLLKHGDSWVSKYDRKSLRILAAVGEPFNVDAWNWYHRVVGEGKRDVIDTWWQTETGGVCLAPRPSAPGAKIVAGKPMRPMFGIDPVLIDKQGEIIREYDAKGSLCLRQPWPGMAKSIYKDHDRFVETYFKPIPGYYTTGDGAVRDAEGFYQITGRLDDVINVTGHRIGTAEIEDVLIIDSFEQFSLFCNQNLHPDVAESAVVGIPHETKGEGIYAYIVLKDMALTNAEQVDAELKKKVRKKIAAYAVPDNIQICSGLPKTRSGKIMRRILRKIAAGHPEDLGDISTLNEPSVVDDIIKGRKKLA